MTFGLRIRDTSGRVLLDTSDRIPRVLGTQYADGNNGSLFDAGLSTGTPFWAFQRNRTMSEFNVGYLVVPTVWVDGQTLHWQYSDPGTISTVVGFIVYGVY